MADPSPVSLNPYSNAMPDQNNLISLDTGTAPNVIPAPAVVQARAAKASFGLGQITGKSQNDVFSSIQNGNEQQFRQEAATQADVQKQQDKQDTVTQIASRAPNAEVLAKDPNALSALTAPTPPTDWRSVIEEYFAKKYVEPMTDISDPFTGSTFMPAALKTIPQDVQKAQSDAASVLSYKDYANTRTEQAAAVESQQSWLGWGADKAKDFLPLYNEFKLRGWTDSGINFTKMLGPALDQERQDLWNLPFNEFKTRFDTIMTKLEHDNPSLAVTFGQAVMGMSPQQMGVMTANTMIGMATGITGQVGGSILRGLVRGAAEDVVKSAALVETPKFAIQSKPSFFTPGQIGTMGNRLAGTPSFFTPNAISDMGTRLSTFDFKAAAAAGAGNMPEAATQKVTRNIVNQVTGNPHPEQVAIEALPTYLRSDADFVRTNPGRSGQEIANRVAEDTVNSQLNMETIVNNLMRINRTPVLVASEDVARLMQAQVRNKYSGPNSTVLDVGDPVWHPASNTYHTDVSIGTFNGEYFANEAQATSFAKLHGFGTDAVVQRQGLGYYIKGTVPIDETQNGIRDALIKMPNAWAGSAHKGVRSGTGTPYLIDPLTGEPSKRTWDVVQAFANSGGGKFAYRSPEETLSKVENEQRKIATFGPNKLMEMFHDNNALVSAANSQDFKSVLINAQNKLDPVTKEHGVFYKSVPELKSAYQDVVGRLPTDAETRGYFAFKNNYEMERGLMSLAMIRNKSRQGVMEYRLTKAGADGKPQQSPYFDARPLDELPKTGDPVYISTGSRETTLNAAKINPKIRKELEDGVKGGQYKVLEIWDRTQRPLNAFTDKIHPDSEPRYVLTNNPDFRPLQFENQVPRRGGGHWIFQYDHYLKQANVYHDPITDKFIYRGDTTVMPFQLRALGEEIGKHFNNIQKFLRDGDEVGARNFVLKLGVAGLDFDRDIKPWFNQSRGPGGEVMPPRFNLTEPFRMVSKDKTIADLDNAMQFKYGDKFEDGTKVGNLARNSTVEFTGKRDAWDLHTIDDKGTINNPVYQYRPAKLMSPIDALNRSTAKIANSTFMDDYKYFAAEHWIQTFGPWLDGVKNIDEIRHSPFYYFMKGEFKKDMPANVRLLAESNRKKIQDFIGTPSWLTKQTNMLTAQAMDALYRKGVSTKLIPYEKLSMSRDPIAVTRSLVGDLKLGLGAIPTFWTQLSAFSNVMAINPQQAPAAALALLMHTWSRVAPQHLDHLDMLASTKVLNWLPGASKWLPGQFKEANLLLREQTGFSTVGSEHANFDSLLTDRGVGTFTDGIRYWGRTAFREGAQAIRTAAWYSAYKDFRDVNPSGALSRADKAWILDRAALLDHDMNRASNSALNSGVMSVPTQFYTYARNLAEDMYGKRLTWQEKARLFTINGILWGLPAGAIGLYGLPIGDYVRKEAEKAFGYVPGQNVGTSVAMDGMLSALGAYITEQHPGDMQSGTWYNFSKFGVSGWEVINAFLDSDLPTYTAMGGATLSSIVNTGKRAGFGFWLQDMKQMIQEGPGSFHPKLQDIADMFKEASSFSHWWKLYMALSTHTWMSNNNSTLENNITAKDAIFRFISGLVPVEVSDITNTRGILEDRKGYVNRITQEYSRNMSLALIARKSGDEDGYNDFVRKAETWLGPAGGDLSSEDKIKIRHQVAERNQDLISSLNKQLSTQHVPASKQEMEVERFKESERLRQKRQGE